MIMRTHDEAIASYITGAISNALDDMDDDGVSAEHIDRLINNRDLVEAALSGLHAALCGGDKHDTDLGEVDIIVLDDDGTDDELFHCKKSVDLAIYCNEVIRPRPI
jgi:hypothetical protein